MDDLVATVLNAVEAEDWETVRLHLHPELHWRGENGELLHGREDAIAMLAVTGRPRPPSSHELRDGQIYRWNA